MLERLLKSPKSEFVAIYGRRHVGQSDFLVCLPRRDAMLTRITARLMPDSIIVFQACSWRVEESADYSSSHSRTGKS